MINNENKNNEKEKVVYNIKVTKAAQFDWGIAFDMEVNGVSIYSCVHRQGTKDGKDWSMITFPSYKGKDGKWYNNVWFPFTKEQKEEIEKQIESML